MGISDETLPFLLQLLADADPQVAGSAWEDLAKEMAHVNCAMPPRSVEAGRRVRPEVPPGVEQAASRAGGADTAIEN